jgi:HD-GYP domain-containing protein (c-di-GMP phosphodiesterase class II)
MPPAGAPAPPEPASDGEGHYLKAVAAVGDTRKLAVAHSIYAANGTKLLDAGATLTSRTLERLVGHRLAAPIEHNLAAEGTLRTADVVARTRELSGAHPLLALFAAREHSERIWPRLAQAPLPRSVLFRLTVAREKFGGLYEHSLRAAFVALFIGTAARLGDREVELLATAALMHDFGMLHADPARFEEGRPLDAAARRQLRAHPLTGMLIAQREPQLNPAIATAIMQHHERLDGSGYPVAPAAEKITRPGRILMLVEIVLAMVEHRPVLPELQLSLILRANHRGFDRDLAGVLLAALPRLQIEDEAAVHDDALGKVARLLADWKEARVQGATGALQEVCGFIDERLGKLRRFLAEAGIDPVGDGGPSSALGDDPTAVAEVNGLMREALWHVRQAAFEAGMQWPHLAGDAAGEGADAAVRRWLRAAGGSAGGTDDPAPGAR